MSSILTVGDDAEHSVGVTDENILGGELCNIVNEKRLNRSTFCFVASPCVLVEATYTFVFEECVVHAHVAVLTCSEQTQRRMAEYTSSDKMVEGIFEVVLP